MCVHAASARMCVMIARNQGVYTLLCMYVCTSVSRCVSVIARIMACKHCQVCMSVPLCLGACGCAGFASGRRGRPCTAQCRCSLAALRASVSGRISATHPSLVTSKAARPGGSAFLLPAVTDWHGRSGKYSILNIEPPCHAC